MRMLLPLAEPDVDPLDAYRITRLPPDRPFVRCNMISTLDGAVTVSGRSGLLGGPPDHRVFEVLRSLADVILVGAGTVRAERYGPVRLDDELRRLRVERGQSALPPIAVVTRSASFDVSSPFFAETAARPIVFVTGEIDEAARRRLAGVADVVTAGTDRVDPHLVVTHLGRAGFRTVLLEGGPGLNAQVAGAGLMDELCLTLSPRLGAGTGPRVLAGPELEQPLDLRPIHLLEEDGFLFYRLAVGAPAAH